MHKLYLSILLVLPFSVSGMQQQVPTFHKVAQEVAGGGGAVVGGAAGFAALGFKPIAILAFKYGSAGCLAGANAIPLIIGVGAFVGYGIAKGTYQAFTNQK